MKRMITFFLLVALPALCFAQKRYMTSLSGGIQVAQPIGEFATYYDGNPIGIAGMFVTPLSNTPFGVGFSAAWNSMASNDEKVPVYLGQDKFGDDIYEEGTMKIRSNHNRFHAIGRFSPFRGPVQIYVDGIAGIGTFATKTRIELQDGTVTDDTGTQRYHWDVALDAGWAAGLKFEVADNILLEGRFESIRGGRTTFVDPETISVINDTEITFETKQSTTDIYTYTLGVCFQF